MLFRSVAFDDPDLESGLEPVADGGQEFVVAALDKDCDFFRHGFCIYANNCLFVKSSGHMELKKMKSPTITLCTYTYNDAEFASDLVRRSHSFTVRPDEIVVVDDGSDVPFSMDGAPENLRILRHESNRGITRAKGAGLSAATGDYIFSMDCDTRVSPDWLERNLPHLLTPEIGLVEIGRAHV